MMDVAANWERVRSRVARAAERAGRPPGSVRIIAVAKTKPVELIEQAIAAGATDIGENYVQEAATKIAQCKASATWHMIGHLQRNKAGRALELFQVIHTVDSVALAEALARHAERRSTAARVLIEVNIAGETTKRGVPPDQVAALLGALRGQEWLMIEGLMAIPPPVATAELARPYFRGLRELRDELRPAAPAHAPFGELSMGMSDDFEVAIEEGATMVRIGRAIFGERDVARET